MDIAQNLAELADKIPGILAILKNKVFILGISAQFFSMLTKGIIKSVKTRSFSLKKMADYGGMPSSHTSFIVSALFGLGLETPGGFQSPVFGIAAVVALIILVDAVKFRGNVDRINGNVTELIKHNGLSDSVKNPKFIAHKINEVVAGVVFAAIYTFLFYMLFGGLF